MRSQLFGLAAGVLLLLSCGYDSTSPYGGGGGGGGGATPNLTVRDFAFNPTPDTVSVGTTVTWSNQGPSAHTATSDAGSAETWDTGQLANGVSGSHQFMSAGKFTYHCTNHPTTMHGTIVVK